MTNLQKIKGTSNYCYGLYNNYKAFKDFHTFYGLNDEYFKPHHCMILSFIVESFHKQNKMPHITDSGNRYVLMNTNYIANNLIYLGIGNRQLKNYIRQLAENKFINLINEGNRNRYINVNSKLIELCYDRDWTMTATKYLSKTKPSLWRSFVNEWEPHFKDANSFKKFIDRFNSNRMVKGSVYNAKDIFQHLLNSVHKDLNLH